ncbi:hypothetical protein ACIQVR_37380 [Streptomyces xanthochromogenes]|uniref:hypothetical protein n=1 Tax=Streptomyces xanthochromogenes TaxID=67384 RepID=UPI003818E069
MMTSNVFGTIVARNLGYANVELQETIARGAAGCRMVVHLVPLAGPASGREYFADVELPMPGLTAGTVPACTSACSRPSSNACRTPCFCARAMHPPGG